MPHAGPQDALFYRDQGRGHAIVFIAGFGGVGSFWARQLAFFQGRFRVIAADQRGTGASARSPGGYSLDQMTDDALGVMDAAGVERATLVGHSTGGAIAQALAVRMPDRVAGLVLSSTWSKPGNYFRRCFEFRRSLLEIGAVDLFHKAGIFFRYPPDYSEAHDGAFDGGGEIDVAVTIARIDAILGADLSRVSGRIAAPTLVLAARDDCLVPAYMSGDLARRIPAARYVEFDRGGHFLPETRSDAYNDAVDGFLDTLDVGARPEPAPARARS